MLSSSRFYDFALHDFAQSELSKIIQAKADVPKCWQIGKEGKKGRQKAKRGQVHLLDIIDKLGQFEINVLQGGTLTPTSD